MRARGQLQIMSGKLISAKATADAAEIGWRTRGGDRIATMRARRVVNASGPQGDLRRTSEKLLHRLVQRGMIRPDPLHIGVDVTPRSEAIDAAGRIDSRLLVIGPMTRGAFWEIVAVPDIRVQTWSVARRLSLAHWVEGEGL